MLTPLPSKITDPKDIVLWALFDRLQRIDENPGTRMSFATLIAYSNTQNQNNPVFSDELSAIRQLLNIPVIQDTEAPETSREQTSLNPADSLKDDI